MTKVWIVLWSRLYGDETDVAEVFAHEADARAYAAARDGHAKRSKTGWVEWASVEEVDVNDGPVEYLP